jgi:hypothetical protein
MKKIAYYVFKIFILRRFASHAHGILPSATVIAFCVDNNMLYIGVEPTCDLRLKNYNVPFVWARLGFALRLLVLSDANTRLDRRTLNGASADLCFRPSLITFPTSFYWIL